MDQSKMLSWLTALLLLAAVASALVIGLGPEQKEAYDNFVKQQEQLLNLFSGIGHNQPWEEAKFDFDEYKDSFTDEKYPNAFIEAYQSGFIPRNGIFNIYNQDRLEDAIKLFDLFYFAEEFETFYKVAKWAKANIQAGVYVFALTHAVVHRSDTQSFVIPPLYEIYPTFYVPTDTLHEVAEAKMEGIKEKQVAFNSSGSEFACHNNEFGGPLSKDNKGYGDLRISYFREDVGLNNYIALESVRNPSWMDTEKYDTPWLKRRGENHYNFIQQMLARYNHERTARGLHFVQILEWNQPIKVGYNPRVAYINGKSMYTRPDSIVPEQFNLPGVQNVETFERRISEIIDYGSVINSPNNSLISLHNDEGIDLLAKIFFGAYDRPNKPYYKYSYKTAFETLAYLTTTASDRTFVGNALSKPDTFARDPAFYNYLARVVKIFENFKSTLDKYTTDDVSFSGVEIQNVEVDQFMTRFDSFDFDVTNYVAMENENDQNQYRYNASSQYRLNHEPYNYNITVNSEEEEGDSIVRVFLGQNYNTDFQDLTPSQARLTFYEIDRFIVKLTSGENVLKRSSGDSPFFVPPGKGFREIYDTIHQKNPFHISECGQFGMPENLQLPMGWTGGRPVRLFVSINKYNSKEAPIDNKSEIACGGEVLYDGRPYGFPFDKPFDIDFYEISNFFFKDVNIYHKK